MSTGTFNKIAVGLNEALEAAQHDPVLKLGALWRLLEIKGIIAPEITEAISEIALLRQHVERLQAALAFWMPGVSEAIETDLNGRAGDDAYLLAGFDGEVPTVSWGDRTLARAEAAEAELANARNAALEEAAVLISKTPVCEMVRTDEDRPERIFENAAGLQSIHDEKLVRSLKSDKQER